MTRLSFIPEQFIKVATASRADLNQYIVGGIHLAPGSSNGLVRAWKVNLPALTDGGEIPIPNAQSQKDDSVDFEILQNGDVLVTYAEAAPGGGGASSQPESVIIPGVFPPADEGSAEGGGGGNPTPASGAYTEAPGGAIRVFARGPFTGQHIVNLAAYAIPPASAINVQITASATVAGRRGCVGGSAISTGMVKVASAEGAPGIRAYNSGLVAPAPDHTLVLMTEGGELAELHLDILGWIY